MHIVLINPNSSAAVTEALALPARAMLGPEDVLQAHYSRVGPVVIQTPEQVLQAADEVLALAQQHAHHCDGVIIGMSLDAGLASLRAQWPTLPVVGMTEAACLHACLLGPRFGLLTLGADMAQLYQAHVASLGLGHRLEGVAVAPWPALSPHAQAEQVQTEAFLQLLAHACQPLLEQGAASIVLAGAVLSGLGRALGAMLGVPVLEGTACAVGLLRSVHAQR
ncbi:hypothetical protein E9531_03625 [Lampropedia puyangensis]|uniref:Hydantoin racemase n=1 Tax=Lampropedia puyangensis TaxID=1330072 RepID=A0A4S8FAF8_9BURK|nr:aspartate/glutamate racemase family protein [Lampropedia puyangensis]THU04490.1 hypothetical protein E9531_03625 [Lampropedia puyangensis]